jgi:putative transposase
MWYTESDEQKQWRRPMREPMSGVPQRPGVSWELPDEVWQAMAAVIPPRKSREGRPRTVNLRRVAEGIFYVLRTGIQWQAVPRERFGPPSTVYYYFRQWVAANVFTDLWAQALTVYDDLQGLEWTWQSIDGAMTKAPLGGRRRGPIPRTVGSAAPSAAS